jgi:pyruvate carboxylase
MASLLFAAEAGVDIVDAALASMAGLTSQPSLDALVAALERQPRDSGLDLEAVRRHSEYWEAVRGYYAPFETELRAPSAEVYMHEIPGGQYSNLRPQAEAMGVGDRIPELKRMYAVVNTMLGDIVKVTPSSKVVGDLAIFMMTHNLSPEALLERAAELTFPESVVGFFAGEIGIPPGGFPESLQKAILKGRPMRIAASALGTKAYPQISQIDADEPTESPSNLRQSAKSADEVGSEVEAPVDFAVVRAELEKQIGRRASEHEVLSYLMYPKVFTDFAAHRRDYSDVWPVPTDVFFYGLRPGEETEVEIEEGKVLFIKLVAVTAPDERGVRTLFYELNGHPREIQVEDRAAGATVQRHPKADPANLHHLGAPMPGAVVEVAVRPGDAVEKDDRLLSLEAMKVLMYITSPITARVKEILVSAGTHVEKGDLLVVFE